MPNNSLSSQLGIILPKLSVNTPGDIYEQEADAMADRVMRSNETAKPVTGLIGKSLQRKCAHCEEEEKKKPIMRKAEAGNSGMSVSTSFASSLIASKGGGSSLPRSTRSFMENAFSTDFSSVRIHADSHSAQMSKAINARAFTHGSDIYFNRGEYLPQSIDGKKLLAHELTHVLQQGVGVNRKIMRKAKPDEPAFYEYIMGGKKIYAEIKEANLQSWYSGYKFFNLFKEEHIYPGSHPNAYATRVYELQEKLHEVLGESSYPESYITGELEPDFSNSPTLNALLGLSAMYEKDPSDDFGLNAAMLVRIGTLIKSIDQKVTQLESYLFNDISQLNLVNSGKSFSIHSGDRGVYVERIQLALLNLNYSIGKDLISNTDTGEAKVRGIYNIGTKKAVEQFQMDSGMEGDDIDGVVGQMTLRLLDQRLVKVRKTNHGYHEANYVRFELPVTAADIPKDPADAERIKKEMLIRTLMQSLPLSKEEAENLISGGKWNWIEYRDVSIDDVAKGYMIQVMSKDDYEKIMGKKKSGNGISSEHLTDQIIEEEKFLRNSETLYNLNAEISKIEGEISTLNSKIIRLNGGKDPVGAPDYMYDELRAKEKVLKGKVAARDIELRKLGITSEEYDLQKGDFVKTFLKYGAMIAFEMLSQNEAKANVEYLHYGNLDEIKKLKETITRLNKYYSDSENYFMQGISWEETGGKDINKYKTRSDYVYEKEFCNAHGICNGEIYRGILRDRWKKNVKDRSSSNSYYGQLFDQEAEAFDYLKRKAPTFAILGNPKFNVRNDGTSFVAKSDEELRDKVQEIIGTSSSDGGIVKNIANTREKIRSDVSIIWEMPPVIATAKMALGIIEGTILDNIINDAYKAHQNRGVWETIGKAALGIGLGLLAIVSGPVGWVALGASIAYGAYDAYSTYQDIKWKTEASETAIDEEAMALMHDKPSMIWFAISLAGVGLDAFQVLKVIKGVKAGIEISKGVKTAINEEIAASRLQLNTLKAGTKEAVDISRRIERLEKALLDIDWVHYAENSKILTILKDKPFAVRFMANALKDPATAKAFTKLAKMGLSNELMTSVIGMYAGIGKKAIGEFPEVMRLIELGKFTSSPELVKTILTDLRAQKALLDSGNPEKIAKLFTEWEAGIAAGKTLSFADHLKQAGLNTFFRKGIVLTERYGFQFSEMSNLMKNKLILREIEPLLADALNAKTLPANVHRTLELSLQRNVLGLTDDMAVAEERMVKEIALLGSSIEFQSDYLRTVTLLRSPESRKLFWDAAVNLPARDEYMKIVEEIAASNPKVKNVMDDLIKIGPVKDRGTIEKLIADDVLRKSLADNPLAVMALKKCASPCFPPKATTDQITRLTTILTGKSPEQISKVNELIYANRASVERLEAAIVKLESATNIDDALKSVNLPEAIIPEVLKNSESIKSLAETVISLGMPSSQVNNIIKNISSIGGAATTSRVEGVLGDLLMVLQIEKKVPMKNLGTLLSGLESSDKGIFNTAEFLTDEIVRFVKPTEIEKGLFAYPGLQKADKLLDTFSLAEIKSIIQKNKLQNGFINNLFSLTQKVNGTKAELLDLMSKAGVGGESDMQKLLRILSSHQGQLAYKDALDAIAKSKAFAAEVAAAMKDKVHGYEKMSKLVWGDDAIVKISQVDGVEIRSIEVAAQFVKGENAGSNAIKMALKVEGKELALANIVTDGSKVNYERWKVLKNVIEDSNVTQSIKNNIIGELWTNAHVRALEKDGWNVLTELKLSDGTTIAKADAVAMKGDQMIIFEFKSMNGVYTDGQKIIYPMLGDSRVKTLKFTESAIADAFFTANREKVKFQLIAEAVVAP